VGELRQTIPEMAQFGSGASFVPQTTGATQRAESIAEYSTESVGVFLTKAQRVIDQISLTVTRATSSTVVTPLATLSMPSSRSKRIPRLRAVA
jgi:hypothetical protein